MRIAYINQPMDGVLPPNQNSIGIWTWSVAPLMAEAGNSVTVLGKRFWVHPDKEVEHDGVRYSFVPPRAPNRRLIGLIDRISNRQELPGYAYRAAYLDYALQVGWRVRRWSADVVHVHNFSQFIPTIRSMNPNTRIVLHMSCEWLSQLDHKVIDRRLEDCQLIAGCSDYITDRIRDRFPNHADRCITIDNGVDTDRFSPAPASRRPGDTPRLLFVGRVSPEKGVHDLIDAFVLVASALPTARLDIVGPIGQLARSFIIDVSEDSDVEGLAQFYDDDYGELLARRIPPELADRVVFHGACAQDEVIAHYQSADILVNPSYVESFGMSLIEAQSCGTPVVATRVGGMPGVVGDDGKAGVLVDRGDVEGLAGEIIALAENHQRRSEMAAEARSRVTSRYTWRQIAETLGTAYAQGGPTNGS